MCAAAIAVSVIKALVPQNSAGACIGIAGAGAVLQNKGRASGCQSEIKIFNCTSLMYNRSIREVLYDSI